MPYDLVKVPVGSHPFLGHSTCKETQPPQPSSLAVLPYSVLRRVSSPSGSRAAPPQPLLRGALGVRPPRARVHTPGEACPPVGALGRAGERAPEVPAQKVRLNFLYAYVVRLQDLC